MEAGAGTCGSRRYRGPRASRAAIDATIASAASAATATASSGDNSTAGDEAAINTYPERPS